MTEGYSEYLLLQMLSKLFCVLYATRKSTIRSLLQPEECSFEGWNFYLVSTKLL